MRSFFLKTKVCIIYSLPSSRLYRSVLANYHSDCFPLVNKYCYCFIVVVMHGFVVAFIPCFVEELSSTSLVTVGWLLCRLNTIVLVHFVIEKPEVVHDSKKHKKQVCSVNFDCCIHYIPRYGTGNIICDINHCNTCIGKENCAP